MASPSPRNTNFADEPSIIIDPSVYVPERRFLLQTLCETFIDATRVLVMVTLSGTTAFGVAQALMRQEAGLDGPTSRVPAALPAEAAAAMDMSLARTSWWDSSAPPAEQVAPRADEAPVALATRSSLATPLPTEVAYRGKLARPVDLAVGVRFGRRMLAMNRFDDAEKAYRKVLVVDEKQPSALLGLARVQLARGRLDDALVLAQRAVEVAPDQASGRLTLGDVLRARGARAPADAQYELAMRLNSPTSSGAEDAATAQVDEAATSQGSGLQSKQL